MNNRRIRTCVAVMVEHYTDLKSAGLVSVNSIRYSSHL